MPSNRLMILDRDGVINEDLPGSIRSLADWRPIRGSIEAIAILSRKGWRVCVATNQSGVGRGYISSAELESIHLELLSMVDRAGGRIDTIAVCPHTPQDRCACRKPGVQLLVQIEQQTGLSARGAPFVGDSIRDIQAALRFGCLPVLVRTGNGKAIEAEAKAAGVKYVFDDLLSATDWLAQA